MDGGIRGRFFAGNPIPFRAVKKRKTGRVSSAKAGRSPGSVDEYFATIAEPALTRLKELRAAIRSVVPRGTSEILSYRIPAFRHKRVLVWYAAFADHCSLFPTSEVMSQFQDELSSFSTSKGTIHFPLERRIPVTLVKKIVKARVARASK